MTLHLPPRAKENVLVKGMPTNEENRATRPRPERMALTTNKQDVDGRTKPITVIALLHEQHKAARPDDLALPVRTGLDGPFGAPAATAAMRLAQNRQRVVVEPHLRLLTKHKVVDRAVCRQRKDAARRHLEVHLLVRLGRISLDGDGNVRRKRQSVGLIILDAIAVLYDDHLELVAGVFHVNRAAGRVRLVVRRAARVLIAAARLQRHP